MNGAGDDHEGQPDPDDREGSDDEPTGFIPAIAPPYVWGPPPHERGRLGQGKRVHRIIGAKPIGPHGRWCLTSCDWEGVVERFETSASVPVDCPACLRYSLEGGGG